MPDDDTPAAAARAFWSGTLTFGLVNVPVDLYAAVRARQTSMRMVDDKGRPLGREYYCPKDGRKLDDDDIVRGYETDGGEMIVVTDEELESVAPELTRDIELRRFVPRAQIPPTYFQRPYFLVPSGRSAKAYHLLAATMQRTGRVGIGTFVMRGHQYLVAILSENGVLRAATLRFSDELRTPEDVGLPRRGRSAARRVKPLEQAVEALTRAALDEEELADRYAGKLRDLAQKKAKEGKDVIDISTRAEADDAEEAGGAEVIDLVQLLRKRLSAKAKTGAAAPPVPARDGGERGEGAPDDLGSWSRQALYDRAQHLGIPGRSRMDKDALVAAIRKARGKGGRARKRA